MEVLKHETFKCVGIRHSEVLTGETMKPNAQIWASKSGNADQFELSKTIQNVCSQDEKWASASHLPFFCSLFNAAASSCTDIFSAVISSWFQIHIVAPSCMLLISHHFLSVIIFHRQFEWVWCITAVMIRAIYVGPLTGNGLCCSAHLITSQVKENWGAAEKQKGSWAHVLRLGFYFFPPVYGVNSDSVH